MDARLQQAFLCEEYDAMKDVLIATSTSGEAGSAGSPLELPRIERSMCIKARTAGSIERDGNRWQFWIHFIDKMDIAISKTCGKCKIPKPASDYWKGGGPDGLQAYCRDCMREYRRKPEKGNRRKLPIRPIL